MPNVSYFYNVGLAANMRAPNIQCQARTTSGGLRFNLKRQRNSSPERGSDISSSLRYTKRYRAVYELDSDDELVERIHISSDGEPEDDINHGQIVFEEMASEVVEYLDITVDSTVRSLCFTVTASD